MDKQAKQVGRRTLALYREMEPSLQQYAAENNVTCRRGCTHCCNLEIFITFPDAVAMAETIMESPKRLAEVTKRCYDQLPHLTEDTAAYFHKNIPCVLLDEKRDCTVYDARPMPCRHYYVTTPPENCSSEGGMKTVGVLNTQQQDVHVMLEALRTLKQRGLPALIAPIPVALLWAFRFLAEGEDAFRKTLLEEPSIGVADIRYWTNVALEKVAREEAPGVPVPAPEGTGSP